MVDKRAGELTSRERDVLRELARGKTNVEIAHALGIGFESVKTYVSRLRAKTGAATRTELGAWAATEESRHEQRDQPDSKR